MLRLWVESYRERPTAWGRASALLSVAAHTVLIAAFVEATRAPEDIEPQHALANRVFYIPPPNRLPAQDRQTERLQFLQLGVPGGSGAFVDAPTGELLEGARSPVAGNVLGLDSINAPALPEIRGPDGVYTEVEVDYQVQRDPFSAAPVYPLALLEKEVQGGVHVRYVVDTAGTADPSSLVVLTATHPEFAQAVREALPGMRFSAARVGASKVRQLVEQEFSFRIDTLVLKSAAQAGKARPDSLHP